MEPSLVDPVLADHLRVAGVEWCLIGAAALATHGYARDTDDVDLLVLDAGVLADAFWGAHPVRIRIGDFDDPLRGSVVWLSAPQIDVVVGTGFAAREALATALVNDRLGFRVATEKALVLLKLEAGGAQDLYDIVALVQRRPAIDGAKWFEEVPSHLPRLSSDARDAWTRLQSIFR
ncbi:MAG: hypothetical protein JST92_25430 [Deltaproteobacteria bacterium]|nr:hypothetical protein [Deltaproteobacteria bacterium]